MSVESVNHVLWDCPTYSSSSRAGFLLELQKMLGNGF